MDFASDIMMIDTCLRKSIELLQRNTTSHGVMAASRTPQAEARNYTRIFARDAAICAFGMLLSQDPSLREGAKNSLLTLAAHQADNGQIPKFVDPSKNEGDFWYVGCIDATLWWLIALNSYDRHVPEDRLSARLVGQVYKALVWLQCQEHPTYRLLQQNEASDWADIMPRSGFVLYTNALWYEVKNLYGLPHPEVTRKCFNHIFAPFSGDEPECPRIRLMRQFAREQAPRSSLYLSFVNFTTSGHEGDVLGNLLAILFGLADRKRAGDIIRELEQFQVNDTFPVRATCRTIKQDDPLWRGYMNRHSQNHCYQYHNGGIWPFIGGFWIMVLAKAGRHALARQELARFAAASAVGNWGFYEWFHGKTFAPNGMPGQSWNAAMFIMARAKLEGGEINLDGAAVHEASRVMSAA